MGFPRFVVCSLYRGYKMTPLESFGNITDATKYRDIKTKLLYGSTDTEYFIWDIIDRKKVL